MSERRIKELKALELKLLQDRAGVLRQQREQLASAAWPREEVEELSRRQDAIEAELARVRSDLRAAERGDRGREGVGGRGAPG